MAARTSRTKLKSLPRAPVDPAPRGARGTRAEALEVIFEPALEMGEGFRTGALGIPRYGKTYHLQEVVDQALERGIAQVALIHDVKRREVQYEGVVRSSVAHLRAFPPGENDPPVIVFHQEPGGELPDAGQVAEQGFELAGAGTPTVVVVDELYSALKSRQTWADPTMGRVFREGSSQGLSVAWTTQVPQSLPTEPLDLSETVALFHLEGRSASYAAEYFRLPPEAAELLGRLERGEFILFSAFRGWDGKIYGPK